VSDILYELPEVTLAKFALRDQFIARVRFRARANKWFKRGRKP